MEHVAGYTIVNDITTRDLVFREDMKEIGTDWYRGKNAPGFLPTGPVPRARSVRRDARRPAPGAHPQRRDDAGWPSDLLFDLPALIAGASQNMPLPGDLLLTGSPAGNGIVHGRMLRDGDVMVGAIEGSARRPCGPSPRRCAMSTPAAASGTRARRPSGPGGARPHRPRPPRRRGGRGVPQLGPLGRRRPARYAQLHRTTRRARAAARAPRHELLALAAVRHERTAAGLAPPHQPGCTRCSTRARMPRPARRASRTASAAPTT